MRDLTLKDIIDLVVSGVPDAELKIQKVYDWHFERIKATSQWMLTAAATLLAAILVAYFTADQNVEIWQIAVALSGAVGIGSYAIYRMWRLRLLHRQLLAALKLYDGFRRTQSFLNRYRQL